MVCPPTWLVYFRRSLFKNDFSMEVDQIEKLVGGKRVVDAMDCRNQTGVQMTLSRFVRYFKRRTKRKILNLLSLEFSDTQFSG